MINFQRLKQNRTFKYGVPMLLLIVGGSFGLREFTQIRYDQLKLKGKLDPALEAKINREKQHVILEEEYQKMQQVNLDEWQNIRGPRPEVDSRSYQEEQRAKLEQKSAKLH